MSCTGGYWRLGFQMLGSVQHACGSFIRSSVQNRASTHLYWQTLWIPIGIQLRELSSLYMPFSTSHLRTTVFIGTMLHFLTLSSPGHERGLALPLIQHLDLMSFVTHLHITVSSPDSASPLCRSNLPSSYLLDSEVPERRASIDKAFSPTL